MVKVQNFSEGLEGSLTRLGVEVAKNLRSPEFKEAPIEKVVKESIKNMPLPPAPTTPRESEKLKTVTANPLDDFLPSYMSGEEGSDEKIKAIVENLVSLALNFDVEKALAESKKYPPFIEDAFHDALTDKLVPELRKRGIIK